jgi:hypothetical protein
MSTDRVWWPLNRPDLGPLNRISNLITHEEFRVPDLLSSVRRGQTLLIAADYGGSHKDSSYETIAFLVADLAFVWLWDDFRKGIRRRFLCDGRRISFKSLCDRHRARAVVPFLRASNTIPGLLITFAISKKRTDILSEPYPDRDVGVLTLSNWDKVSFSRLTRISFLGSMLVACMSAPGQDVLWFTDQDEIAPNTSKMREATNVVGHYISHLCPHPLGHVRFGTTYCDDGSLEIEDLAAIPDLAAGALAELFSRMKDQQGLAASPIALSLPAKLSRKAHMIVGWVADGPHPLRKLVVTVDDVGEKEYRTSIVWFAIDQRISEFDWTTDVDEYMRDKIIVRKQ